MSSINGLLDDLSGAMVSQNTTFNFDEIVPAITTTFDFKPDEQLFEFTGFNFNEPSPYLNQPLTFNFLDINDGDNYIYGELDGLTGTTSASHFFISNGDFDTILDGVTGYFAKKQEVIFDFTLPLSTNESTPTFDFNDQPNNFNWIGDGNRSVFDDLVGIFLDLSEEGFNASFDNLTGNFDDDESLKMNFDEPLPLVQTTTFNFANDSGLFITENLEGITGAFSVPFIESINIASTTLELFGDFYVNGSHFDATLDYLTGELSDLSSGIDGLLADDTGYVRSNNPICMNFDHVEPIVQTECFNFDNREHDYNYINQTLNSDTGIFGASKSNDIVGTLDGVTGDFVTNYIIIDQTLEGLSGFITNFLSKVDGILADDTGYIRSNNPLCFNFHLEEPLGQTDCLQFHDGDFYYGMLEGLNGELIQLPVHIATINEILNDLTGHLTATPPSSIENVLSGLTGDIQVIKAAKFSDTLDDLSGQIDAAPPITFGGLFDLLTGEVRVIDTSSFTDTTDDLTGDIYAPMFAIGNFSATLDGTGAFTGSFYQDGDIDGTLDNLTGAMSDIERTGNFVDIIGNLTGSMSADAALVQESTIGNTLDGVDGSLGILNHPLRGTFDDMVGVLLVEVAQTVSNISSANYCLVMADSVNDFNKVCLDQSEVDQSFGRACLDITASIDMSNGACFDSSYYDSVSIHTCMTVTESVYVPHGLCFSFTQLGLNRDKYCLDIDDTVYLASKYCLGHLILEYGDNHSCMVSLDSGIVQSVKICLGDETQFMQYDDKIHSCFKPEDAVKPCYGTSVWVDYPYVPPVNPDNPTGSNTNVLNLDFTNNQGTYCMHNIITAQLLDNTIIELESVNISSNTDSFTFAFSAKLADDTQANLLYGTNGEPVHILININGVDFEFLVEDVSTGLVFGNSDVSIKGRGVVALLATPFHIPTTLIQQALSGVQQIADMIIPNGHTVNWTSPTFNVTGGAYSHSNKAPIAALLQLAQDVGSVIVPTRTGTDIKIAPRYKVLPWNFATASPDVVVPLDVVTAMTRVNPVVSQFNGIYVHGSSIGAVQGFCRLVGTSGNVLLPTVSATVLTNNIGVEARAARELAKFSTQPDIKSFTMPMYQLGAVNDQIPLLEVGQFIEVGTVRGVVSSVSLSATLSYVEQVITIGESSNNVFTQFKEINAQQPLLIAEIISTTGTSSVVNYIDGGAARVHGTGTVGQRKFIRDARIVGDAPNIPNTTIVIS